MYSDFKWIISLFLISNFFYAQDNHSGSYKEGITIGHIDTLYSTLLKEERELIIYLPESVSIEDYKREKYPVIYLLDGRSNFLQLVALVRQYAEKNDTEILPEMIIVGISNKDQKKRTFDFSPTKADDPDSYGGGDQFLEFIEKELFPYIEDQYPAAGENRTIIGHSFGGVAVLNALSRHSEMFENCVFIDGSLWFDNELFLKDPEFSLKGKDLTGKNLFVGIANTSQYGSSLESIKTDTMRVNKYVRHSLELIEQVTKSSTGPDLEWKYYENDTHGSSVFLTQLDALRSFYSWFEFKEIMKYQGKYNLPTAVDESFANLTDKHFRSVSEELGYEFYPTLPWFLNNSDMLLNYHNLPKQARELLILSKNYYPDNAQIEQRLKQID